MAEGIAVVALVTAAVVVVAVVAVVVAVIAGWHSFANYRISLVGLVMVDYSAFQCSGQEDPYSQAHLPF